MLERIAKLIRLEYTGKTVNLPENLKRQILDFWREAVLETPTLYNGKDFTVEEVSEAGAETIVKIAKTNYAHYLYDERVGIKDKRYRCFSPWSGILLLTSDNYWVVGQASNNTSFPNVLEISGGGIDEKDMDNTRVDLVQTLKRELREEIGLDLAKVDYEFEYIDPPNEYKSAYGFIAVGKLNISKDELQSHFKKYKDYLARHDLEIEFSELIFLRKGSAVLELDSCSNPKREYLRELISRVDS